MWFKADTWFKMIQTWFREKSTSFKYDEGGLLDMGTQLKVILIVIESDSEPRGELLLIQNCSKWFKIDSERNQHDSNLF